MTKKQAAKPTKLMLVSVLYNDKTGGSLSVADPRFQPPIIPRKHLLRLQVTESAEQKATFLLTKANALKLYTILANWLM